MSIPVHENKFTNITERFFDITGTNKIITDNKVELLDEQYSKILEFNNLKIWNRENTIKPVRIVCSLITSQNLNTIINKLLLSEELDLSNEVISMDKKNYSRCLSNTKVINADFGYPGGIKVEVNNPSGIIATNIVYNEFIEAISSNAVLDKFKCNY